jgi:hypothetical protein
MRSLVHDDLFARQLSDLELHIPGVRAAISGLARALCTDPELGTKIREIPPTWFVPLPDVAEQPLGISYVFDETRVKLLSIWIS